MFEREREREKEKAKKQNDLAITIAKLRPIGVERYIGTEKRQEKIIQLEKLEKKAEREKYEISSDTGTALQLIFND
ncbi:hypothetical protein KAU40_02835 [Candidatus Parcubacteria bacterium]|nr:hypothetical protein [Candidatus Parcubacteria bacterium]